VSGAVAVPGRYPYIPERTWDYYIALAGGFTERNTRDVINMTDANGRKMQKTDIISPETVIVAETNDFLYHFNRIAPIVTTGLSIISAALTLMVALGAFN
jgi:protein involved in polysaccharide export with SLBB domain